MPNNEDKRNGNGNLGEDETTAGTTGNDDKGGKAGKNKKKLVKGSSTKEKDG